MMHATQVPRRSCCLRAIALAGLAGALACGQAPESGGKPAALLGIECESDGGAFYEDSPPFSWQLRVRRDGTAELSSYDRRGELSKETAELNPEDFGSLATAFYAVEQAACVDQYISPGIHLESFKIRAICADRERAFATYGSSMPVELRSLQESLIAVKRSIQGGRPK